MKLILDLFRAKPTQAPNPHADIAQRLETLESCEAYRIELQNRLVDHPKDENKLAINAALRQKIAVIAHAVARHRLQASCKAATAAISDSQGVAASAIKAAEKAQAVADDEHARAVQACAAMKARMAPLSERIKELHQLAAQRVQTAQASFDAVMTQPDADEAAELKASQTLIEAQQSLTSSGAAERMRLDKLSQQLETLKAAEQAAAQAQGEAVQALNQALCMKAMADFDAASIAVLDAYFLAKHALARPGSEVPGWRFPNPPSPWFTRGAHVPGYGRSGEDNGGELSAYTVRDMADAFKPINLAVLAAPLPVIETDDDTNDNTDPSSAATEQEPTTSEQQRVQFQEVGGQP